MNTKEKIEVMQAYLDGKTIQIKCIEEWSNIIFEREPLWQWDRAQYRIKPEQNIIDMDMMVGSNVDCEFYDNKNRNWIINSLTELSSGYHYLKDNILPYSKCRVRENHWIYHSGSSKRPIPEGLEVIVQCVGNREMFHYINTEKEPDWGKVTVFKVIGNKDGWVYPWEVKNEQ